LKISLHFRQVKFAKDQFDVVPLISV